MAAVLHLGSATTRAGRAYELRPAFISETLPTGIQRGLISDWDAFTAAASHALARHCKKSGEPTQADYEREGDAGDSTPPPVLIVDSPATSDKARERLAEVMLEGLHVPAVFALYDLVGGVYSAGRTSAVVVDAGAECTHSAAVLEGFVLPHTLQRLPLGGADLSQHLRACMAERGVTLTPGDATALLRTRASVATDFVKEAFERRARVLPSVVPVGAGGRASSSSEGEEDDEEDDEDEEEEGEDEEEDEAQHEGHQENDAASRRNGTDRGGGGEAASGRNAAASSALPEDVYVLPDGRQLVLADEPLRCGEVLFQPGLVGCRSAGLAEHLAEVVRTCLSPSETNQVHGVTRFVLGMGGCSLLPGLDSRLHHELTAGDTNGLQTYVSTLQEEERWHAAWIGGSIVASLPGFIETNFVSRAEYDEIGPAAIHKRC